MTKAGRTGMPSFSGGVILEHTAVEGHQALSQIQARSDRPVQHWGSATEAQEMKAVSDGQAG